MIRPDWSGHGLPVHLGLAHVQHAVIGKPKRIGTGLEIDLEMSIAHEDQAHDSFFNRSLAAVERNQDPCVEACKAEAFAQDISVRPVAGLAQL